MFVDGAVGAAGVEESWLQPAKTRPLNTHKSKRRDVFFFISPKINRTPGKVQRCPN
jgi:hypothetical protein